MVVIRCTQPLVKQLRLTLDASAPAPDNVLGDWYATRLNVGSLRAVILVSERALVPVLMPARRNEFPTRFWEYLAVILERIGIPEHAVETETHATKHVSLAPTQSRRILGTLNDFGQCARIWLRDGFSPLETTLKLAGMPPKVLNYEFPEEVARTLFAS